MEEQLKEKVLEAASLASELETRKKNLDWFDYQVRGNRWSSKSQEEIRSERQEILDDIARLETEFSMVHKELNGAYEGDVNESP